MIGKGALVGMIIGIVAGIAILAGGIWFFFRRHKRNKAATYSGAVLANSTGSEEKGNGTGSDTAAEARYKGPNANTSELHNEDTTAIGVNAVSVGSSPRPTDSELAASPNSAVVRKPVGGSSPVHGKELGGSPMPMGSELPGSSYAGYRPEVHEAQAQSPRPQGSELAGSGYSGHNPNVYEAAGGYENALQQQNEGYGYSGYQGRQAPGVYGNNAEPVYEMPGQGGWRQAPHRQ